MFNSKLKIFTFCLASVTAVLIYAQNKKAPEILKDFKIPPKNFVRNGSFNKGLNGWHYFKKKAGQVVNEGRDNDPCFKISGQFEDHLYLYNKGLGKGMGWAVNLKEGKTYTVSVWFKAENVKKLYLDSAIFIVNYGWSRSVQIGPGASTTKGWVKVSKTFVAPEQTRKHDRTSNDYSLLIYWPNITSGTLWIDDIQVEEGSKATEYSDLCNFDVLNLSRKLEEAYAKISKAETVLKKRFPKAISVMVKFKKYLRQLKKVAAGLKNPAEVEKTCSNGENIVDNVMSKVSEIMFPIWFKNPYKMSQRDDFPPSLAPFKTQKFSCYIAQTRNLGLMMTNLSGEHIDAKISPQTFVNEQTQERINGNNFITVYNTPLLPGNNERNKLFTDPLPEANGINGITVPAGVTRQAIISFSTEKLLPGKYKGSILLMTLTDKTFTKTIPVEFEVKPVTLPVQVPGVDVLPLGGVCLHKEEVKRLGHNFIAVSLLGFPPNVDRSGNLLPVDYTTLNNKIKESRKLSPNCKFMLIFSTGAKFIDRANRKGLKWPDPRLKKAWQKWLKGLFANLKKQGVSTRDFLIQVVDEPGSGQVVFAAELHKLSKETVPGLQITATLTGWSSDDNYKRFYDTIDYIIPTVRAARKNPELLKYFKARGDKVQTAVYECAESAESLNPISYYRMMPWYVWKNKLKGWIYWQRDDRNPNFSCVKKMSTVYPLKDENFTTPIWPEDKYIISRRWLALEAGFQDYKSLYLLDKVIKETSKVSGVDKNLIAQAESFLKKAPNKAFTLDDIKEFPRALAKGANPDILDDMNETALKLTAELLKYDKLQVAEKPVITNGILSLKTNKPTSIKVEYLLDGKLPWLTVAADELSDVHKITLPKNDGQQINKCKVILVDSLGKTLVTSPFIMPKVTADSVFPNGYDLECVIDGVRVPGAQYWPGKTWISNGASSEHWVALEWDNPEKISRVNICWMTRGGLPGAYKVQYRKNGKWLDITKGWVGAKSGFEKIKFDPVEADAVKVIQKASGGTPLSLTLMGISELEVF